MDQTIMIENVVREAYKNGSKVRFITRSGQRMLKRIGKTANDEYLVMRTQIRGMYLGTFIWQYSIVGAKEVKATPRDVVWLRNINKAINMLSKSGLWPEMLEEFKKAREIGYEKLNEAHRLYWSTEDKERVEVLEKVHPYLVKETKEGTKIPNTDILWHMINIKIKKMYFGREDNKRVLSEIKNAMSEGKEYKVFADTNYDVSFNYDGKDKAWYSEEYKGCGNGHYYLALNETHAWFYEDD